MFKIIESLLRQGDTVSVTVAREGDTHLRVTTFPKLFTMDGDKGSDRQALNQPLCIIGTAEELDAEFAPTLVKYTHSAMTLRHTLDEVEAAHKEAAAKATKPEGKPAAPKKISPQPDADSEGDQPKNLQPGAPATPSLF